MYLFLEINALFVIYRQRYSCSLSVLQLSASPAQMLPTKPLKRPSFSVLLMDASYLSRIVLAHGRHVDI